MIGRRSAASSTSSKTAMSSLFEMKCRGPKEGDIDVSMTMTMTVNSPQSTTRVIKSTMRVGGQTRVINATTEFEMAFGKLR